MAISQKDVEEIKQSHLEHQKKMQTDPQYRAECEKISKMLEEKLKVYPHED